MGWASGGEVFDPVADKLIEMGATDDVKREVCTVLIDALQDRGWDTESESLGMYYNDPAIVAAFRACDITQSCGAEHDTEPWCCELDLDHAGDHDDRCGHAWRDIPASALLDDARALARALWDRMRDFVPDEDAFGEGLSWETLPAWLVEDGTGRQLWAHGAETGNDA